MALLCYVEIVGVNTVNPIMRTANSGYRPPWAKHADGSLEWIDTSSPPLDHGLGAKSGTGRRRRRSRRRERRGGRVALISREDTTRPVVIFGAALKRPLSARTALRIEARATTTFYDEMSVTAFDGRPAVLEGGSVTTGFLTVGVELGF